MPTVFKRGTDQLTTVDVSAKPDMSAEEIASLAHLQSSLPQYQPDGCAAILLFHTDEHPGKVQGLGGMRKNPALEGKLDSNGSPYPMQVNTSIGGKLCDPQLPLHQSILSAIKYKLFYDENLQTDSPIYNAQLIIQSLIHDINAPQGWSTDVCVHTDQWQDKDTVCTMSFLTRIKHIYCSQADLEKLVDAIGQVMKHKETAEKVPIRNLTDCQIYDFTATMRNATEILDRTNLSEQEKAELALTNGANLTFNDLALKTLQANDSYHQTTMVGEVVRLDLDRSPVPGPAVTPSRGSTR